MHEDQACIECHLDGLFLYDMPEYERCNDCHEVTEIRTESKNSDKDKDED